jgi:hypothetical protein
MKKFGDTYVEHVGKKGYRPRQSDEKQALLIKNLMRELRDDALLLIDPKVDTPQSRKVRQELGRASLATSEVW